MQTGKLLALLEIASFLNAIDQNWEAIGVKGTSLEIIKGVTDQVRNKIHQIREDC